MALPTAAFTELFAGQLQFFQAFLAAYDEPHRHYHNSKHLAEMAEIIVGVVVDPIFRRNLLFACAYHDIIYDTQSKDNEENSAARAVSELTAMQLSPGDIEYIRDLIISTKKHLPLRDDNASLIFLDADLAILSSGQERYGEYAQAIRQEYAWVNDADYAVGRRQVLEKFLARERIYFSEAFFSAHESQARANVNFELDKISGRR